MTSFKALVAFGALVFALCACSEPNSDAPVFLNGEHAPQWVDNHGDRYLDDDKQCRLCHGDDLDGGIVAPEGSSGAAPAGPTCFSTNFEDVTCHGSTGPFGHPDTFVAKHGEMARNAPAMTDDGPQGFEECVDCHGADLTGRPFPQAERGPFDASANCVNCHDENGFPFITEPAPHLAAAEWDEQHPSTNQDNAEVCAECHRNRDHFRSDIWGDLPFQYDADAEPGCFNSTLCHGNLADPHVNVPDWSTPTVHGARAKLSPEVGIFNGFVNCSRCHTEDFSRNCANTCHVPPHPAAWAAPDGTYTHTTTSVDNVAACAQCHLKPDATGSVGCFNNTLCHASVNPHAAEWEQPVNHGAAAKQPVPPVGVNELASFSSCQICHGESFNQNACGTCHGPQPHPSAWAAPDGTYTHTSTDTSNAVICFDCHAGGNNSPLPPPPTPEPGASPDCFNNTLCHGVAGSPHDSTWPEPANHGASAKVAPSATNNVNSFVKCSICHLPDFSANCFGCHGVNAPHAAEWRLAGVYSHQTTNGANAVVCAECHAAGNNSPLPPPSPPPAGTPAGCFNNTLCHGQAISPHDPTWPSPSNHGSGAKAANGYAYCSSCHTPTFGYNCTNVCHTPPHPSAWDVKAVYTHQNTNTSNAAVCANCHRSNPGTAGCFNNTLCHGQVGGTGPAHPVHMALPTPANTCTTCHNTGAPPTIVFNSAYNAKSGAATFNDSANTCANVSCHGGQTTPVWATGSIDVNAQCSSCHTYGTSQYNGPFTGNHNRSDHRSRACTACHDTTRLATSHFITLNTPALNNPAGTIRTSLNYSGGTCRTPGCHGSESW